MELYIKIRNGQPFEHPILGSNFKENFSHIDTNNLPSEFARFERITIPEAKEYEIYESTTYEWFDNVVRDVHHFRPMNDAEKAAFDEQKKKSPIMPTQP